MVPAVEVNYKNSHVTFPEINIHKQFEVQTRKERYKVRHSDTSTVAEAGVRPD